MTDEPNPAPSAHPAAGRGLISAIRESVTDEPNPAPSAHPAAGRGLISAIRESVTDEPQEHQKAPKPVPIGVQRKSAPQPAA
jgi:hypothetical protein